jgi:hypothetical protein
MRIAHDQISKFFFPSLPITYSPPTTPSPTSAIYTVLGRQPNVRRSTETTAKLLTHREFLTANQSPRLTQQSQSKTTYKQHSHKHKTRRMRQEPRMSAQRDAPHQPPATSHPPPLP